MKTKDVCLSLLRAESEAEVEKIISSVPEMTNPKNWRPLDGRETNFNVTSNQASDGGKALTELMTNMVDAVLMKHAYQKNIDPRGPDAPKTMYEAVDKLVKKMFGGKLVNLAANDKWLSDFASKNLVIGVTGAKNKKKGQPCYTFVDNGEGQRPEDFTKTFLSLSAGTKSNIPFVQGKYNMGSSGVLGYCGDRWFKLIVSRRYDSKSGWGWTLMRRRPSDGMPVAEFFVLPDGTIPSFTADCLYPFQTGDKKVFDRIQLPTGTIIKLFDYQVGSKFQGFRGAREALNENLVETILPFRIFDFRWTPDAKRGGDRALGIDARPFYGMEFLLLKSHAEQEQSPADDDDDDEAEGETEPAGIEMLTVGTVSDPELGEIIISAIPLKRNVPGWLKPQSTNNRVFHTVNGQVQFKQTRGYLSQACGFPALKDRTVIVVDASNLSFPAHNDVWKGDREHIRKTNKGERYQAAVTQAIRQSEALKDLQHKIAREELDRATKSERNDLFQKLLDSDRTLVGLLNNRDPEIRLPSAGGGNSGGESGAVEFDGKFSPTFVRFEGKLREAGVNLPINRTRPITARTDVKNGYLIRADNTGHIVLSDDVKSRFVVRSQLHNGRLTLFLDPIEGKLSVGDSFTLNVGLSDDSMAQPVSDEVTIRIVEPESEPKKPKPPGPKPPESEGAAGGSNKKGEGSDAKTHGLPKYCLLTEDGRQIGEQETEQWPDGFTKEDGGMIAELGDNETMYKINYDNSYHIKYRQQQRTDIARDAITDKYVLGMRIMMLGFEHAYQKQSPESNGVSEFADDFRRMAARGAASTVLALAENLPKIVDTSAIANAEAE
jgi:hypothetical protein